jgi:hypothetical protein
MAQYQRQRSKAPQWGGQTFARPFLFAESVAPDFSSASCVLPDLTRNQATGNNEEVGTAANSPKRILRGAKEIATARRYDDRSQRYAQRNFFFERRSAPLR